MPGGRQRSARHAAEAGLEVVLCAGEETGCEGSPALARADGALGRAGAVLVAEPTTNVPCVAHEGIVRLDAVAEGLTAHGSMPHLGRNAVLALARALTRLDDRPLRSDPHPLLRGHAERRHDLRRININSVPDRASRARRPHAPGIGADDVGRPADGRAWATRSGWSRGRRSTRSTPTRTTHGHPTWCRS